jgi:hypothetical protein
MWGVTIDGIMLKRDTLCGGEVGKDNGYVSGCDVCEERFSGGLKWCDIHVGRWGIHGTRGAIYIMDFEGQIK